MNELVREMAKKYFYLPEHRKDFEQQLDSFSKELVGECADIAFDFWCAQLDNAEESAHNEIMKRIW